MLVLATHRRRLRAVLAPLFELVLDDPRLEGVIVGTVETANRRLPVTRFVYRGPPAETEPLRLGIFAVVHGDEPAGASAVFQLLFSAVQDPEFVRGIDLYCYPVCNPTGFEDGTRCNRAGLDLNREFWRNSACEEVRALEAELRANRFNGLIALHADCDSAGLYAFARGSVIAHELVGPALTAAERICSRNCDVAIDGFTADHGVIRDCYPGVLSAPPDQAPAPFEIIFETPGRAAMSEQAAAAWHGLRGVIEAMPRLYAVAAGI